MVLALTLWRLARLLQQGEPQFLGRAALGAGSTGHVALRIGGRGANPRGADRRGVPVPADGHKQAE